MENVVFYLGLLIIEIAWTFISFINSNYKTTMFCAFTCGCVFTKMVYEIQEVLK